MHGTFKYEKTLSTTSLQQYKKSKARTAAAKVRAAKKLRDKEFQLEFARAKATPVASPASRNSTLFC